MQIPRDIFSFGSNVNAARCIPARVARSGFQMFICYYYISDHLSTLYWGYDEHSIWLLVAKVKFWIMYMMVAGRSRLANLLEVSLVERQSWAK